MTKHGVKELIFRTYANARALIPDLLDWGFTCLWACEVDLKSMNYADLRREFGADLNLIGGIDIDLLFRGREAVEREVTTVVPPLLDQGGYIPLADGRLRTGVPLADYVYYRRLLHRVDDRLNMTVPAPGPPVSGDRKPSLPWTSGRAILSASIIFASLKNQVISRRTEMSFSSRQMVGVSLWSHLVAISLVPGAAVAAKKVKAAWVYVGPIGDHGWTYAHDQGRLAVEKELGVETTYMESVGEARRRAGHHQSGPQGLLAPSSPLPSASWTRPWPRPRSSPKPSSCTAPGSSGPRTWAPTSPGCTSPAT